MIFLIMEHQTNIYTITARYNKKIRLKVQNTELGFAHNIAWKEED